MTSEDQGQITMANSKLLKEAIADAKAVRETALANAKIQLAEAFAPRLSSMLSKKLQAEMQDKRAYGFGPVAQKMQNDIETKRGEKDKYVNEKRTSVESWRKQLDQVNTKINTLADDLRIEYKENEQKAHGYDGLLKRIQISHEIGGMVPWLILMVFYVLKWGQFSLK